MTKDKAYEAAKKLGERAGHDETVLRRGPQNQWISIDTDAGSPADKVNIEVDNRSNTGLPRVVLQIHGLDEETAERIIDIVKERDAAVRLGAEVAEAAAAVEAQNAATLTPIPPPKRHNANFSAATSDGAGDGPVWPRPQMTHYTTPDVTTPDDPDKKTHFGG